MTGRLEQARPWKERLRNSWSAIASRMSHGLLVMFAGGDPWKVNAALQSGRPAPVEEIEHAGREGIS
jgi:hypothetical protein